MSHRLARLARLLVLVAIVLPADGAAQADQRCFPETGLCITGRIREFWETNGGLPVFGLPITAQAEEPVEGQPVQAQWFERHRLELHPQNTRPYDVLLGRLGADRLAQLGRDPASWPKTDPRDGCRYFAETGHNVCGLFLAAWRASGLEQDGAAGLVEAENLALFGLPLSDIETETIGGQTRTVQWFERARFEAHPENQPPYHVLFGLLGREVRATASGPPPTTTPPVEPPAPAGSPYDGAWYGTISRGTELSFIVDQGRVTYLEIDIKPDPDCHIVSKIEFAKLGLTPPPIENGRVVIHFRTEDMEVNLAGAFASDRRVDGRGDFRSYDVGCRSAAIFTWQATKAPPEPVIEPISGTWEGRTKKDEEITLVVSGRTITGLTIIPFRKPECTIQVTTPQPLTVNSFVLAFATDTATGYINGRFTSSQAVNGFIRYTSPVKGCGYGAVGEWLWQATKRS